MSAVPKISGVEKLVIRWSNYKICLWTIDQRCVSLFFGGLFYLYILLKEVHVQVDVYLSK